MSYKYLQATTVLLTIFGNMVEAKAGCASAKDAKSCAEGTISPTPGDYYHCEDQGFKGALCVWQEVAWEKTGTWGCASACKDYVGLHEKKKNRFPSSKR